MSDYPFPETDARVCRWYDIGYPAFGPHNLRDLDDAAAEPNRGVTNMSTTTITTTDISTDIPLGATVTAETTTVDGKTGKATRTITFTL